MFLIIAAQFDAFTAGCLAVVTMALGIAATNFVFAGSGRFTRRRASAALLIARGSLVSGLCLLFLWSHIA